MDLLTTLPGSLLEGFLPAGWDLKKIDQLAALPPEALSSRRGWWHAQFDPVRDARAGQWIGGSGVGVAPGHARGHVDPVQGIAQPVDHASQERLANGDPEGRTGRMHAGPRADPVQLTERHEQRAPAAEAHDLARDRSTVAAVADHAHLADLHLHAGGLDDQPDQVGHLADATGKVGLLDGLDRAAQVAAR